MPAWNSYASANTHIDKVLTNISLAYPNNEFVGNKLFPTVNVLKQTDKYYWFGRETWVPEDSDYRAPGTEANEIPGLNVALDTYFATEHSLQIAVYDEERENVDSPLSPDSDATNLVTQKILLARELAMMNIVTNANNYATTNTVTLSGTAQWSDYVNSDPVAAVHGYVRTFHSNVFFEPNNAVVPYQVMSILEDHPKILARIMYTDRGILTPEIIASVLGLQNVIIPEVAYGSGVGFSVTASYLWGKNVLLAYVPKSAGLRVPAFAYEFVWGYKGNGAMLVDRWREEKRKSDLIRCSRRYDLKLVGVETNPDSANFGKSITGFLIKNAVA